MQFLIGQRYIFHRRRRFICQEWIYTQNSKFSRKAKILLSLHKNEWGKKDRKLISDCAWEWACEIILNDEKWLLLLMLVGRNFIELIMMRAHRGNVSMIKFFQFQLFSSFLLLLFFPSLISSHHQMYVPNLACCCTENVLLKKIIKRNWVCAYITRMENWDTRRRFWWRRNEIKIH